MPCSVWFLLGLLDKLPQVDDVKGHRKTSSGEHVDFLSSFHIAVWLVRTKASSPANDIIAYRLWTCTLDQIKAGKSRKAMPISWLSMLWRVCLTHVEAIVEQAYEFLARRWPTESPTGSWRSHISDRSKFFIVGFNINCKDMDENSFRSARFLQFLTSSQSSRECERFYSAHI